MGKFFSMSSSDLKGKGGKEVDTYVDALDSDVGTGGVHIIARCLMLQLIIIIISARSN